MSLSSRLLHYFGATAIAGLACSNAAVAAATEYGEPTHVGTEQIIQVAGGLFLVLFLIAIAAFVARRLKGVHGMGGKQIRVVDGVSVGARDRILLIEVEDKKILLGLSPGRIRALHVFDHDDRTFKQALGDSVAQGQADKAA